MSVRQHCRSFSAAKAAERARREGSTSPAKKGRRGVRACLIERSATVEVGVSARSALGADDLRGGIWAETAASVLLEFRHVGPLFLGVCRPSPRRTPFVLLPSSRATMNISDTKPIVVSSTRAATRVGTHKRPQSLVPIQVQVAACPNERTHEEKRRVAAAVRAERIHEQRLRALQMAEQLVETARQAGGTVVDRAAANCKRARESVLKAQDNARGVGVRDPEELKRRRVYKRPVACYGSAKIAEQVHEPKAVPFHTALSSFLEAYGES